MKEASMYIKKSAYKKDLFSLFLYKYVFSKYNEIDEDIYKISTSNKKDDDNQIIKVNMYKSFVWENNNFIYFLKSTISQAICNEFLDKIRKLKSFDHVEDNLIHNNDPNTLCVFYYFKSIDILSSNNIIASIMKKHGFEFNFVGWCSDMFFDERMISPDVLKLLLNH